MLRHGKLEVGDENGAGQKEKFIFSTSSRNYKLLNRE
jgi:hypothetical protein